MAGRTIVLRDPAGGEHQVRVTDGGTVVVGDATVEVREMTDGSLQLRGPGQAVAWAVVVDGTGWAFVAGRVFTFEVAQPGRRRAGAAHHGPITAPMPAAVRKVAVAAGDTVQRGDVLVVLEAMKMEMPVRADADGTVRAVNCREGEMVRGGEVLVELD